jgi:hypothetical protein
MQKSGNRNAEQKETEVTERHPHRTNKMDRNEQVDSRSAHVSNATVDVSRWRMIST